MDDELIGSVHCEIQLINDELDFQTEKYMNIQKKLGESSGILDRNRMLLINLKKRTEMSEILRFMGMILFVVLIVVSVKYHEYVLILFNKLVKYTITAKNMILNK